MVSKKLKVNSGVSQLDQLLDGLYIGDNVVWHDEAGSLAGVFCLNFIQASQERNKPIIYVSFDRSPKNLLDKLGSLAHYQHLIILDCFTYGKGSGSIVFLKFYEIKCEKDSIVDAKELKSKSLSTEVNTQTADKQITINDKVFLLLLLFLFLIAFKCFSKRKY